jgi:hypothetical protein
LLPRVSLDRTNISNKHFEQTFRTNISNKHIEQTFRTNISNKSELPAVASSRLSVERKTLSDATQWIFVRRSRLTLHFHGTKSRLKLQSRVFLQHAKMFVSQPGWTDEFVKKIAQNVAQCHILCQNFIHILHIIGKKSNFFKLPKVNNLPLGENSPDLVTLVATDFVVKCVDT